MAMGKVRLYQRFIESFEVKVLVIVSFWYVALYPGRLGYDYALAIRMIQNNESTNWWTGIYFWFLRIFTFGGQTIAVVSLIGIVILAYSLYYFLKSIIEDRSLFQRTYIAILFFPLFGNFGVTVSHDVFQASGIIVFLGVLNEVRKGNVSERLVALHFFLGSLLIITTQTGLLTVFAMAFLFLFTRFRKLAFVAPFALVISLSGNIGVGPSIIPHPIHNILLSDIRCVSQHPEAMISESDWQVLNEISKKKNWLTPLSCSNADQLISTLRIPATFPLSNSKLVSTYLRIAFDNPLIVLQAHIQRSLGALPPPFFRGPENQVDQNIQNPVGLGTNTALQKGPEILHPSIDEDSVDSRVSFLKPLEALAQISIFLFNQASWFWGWGGLWLWPIVVFYIRFIPKWSWGKLATLLCPILLLHFIQVVVGPGPLGRYYLSTILVGVSLSIAMTIRNLDRIRMYGKE